MRGSTYSIAMVQPFKSMNVRLNSMESRHLIVDVATPGMDLPFTVFRGCINFHFHFRLCHRVQSFVVWSQRYASIQRLRNK
jgi:hypothetical protein